MPPQNSIRATALAVIDRGRAALSAAADAATVVWSIGRAAGAREVTIPAPWQERDPAILGNRLTPTVMASLIRRRNEGFFQEWVDLGAEFLGGKNPHLLTQLGVRRASVSETRFLVRPGKGSNRRGATLAARDFEELLARWKARQEWEQTLAQVTQAEFWGRSLHEVLWSDSSGIMAPERLAWVHPRRLSYACPINDPDPWTIRIHDPDDPYSPFFGAYGIPISRWHADKFILHECTPLGVHRTGEGLLAGLIWYLLMYEWSWRDLLALIELLGRPGHIGYYAAGGAKNAAVSVGQSKFDGTRPASPEEQKALVSAVRNVSGSLRAVLADTTRVEPLQYGQRATPLQLEAIQHIEQLISKVVSGSTGVTDIVAGARAAHEVAWMQSLTFWRYDVRRVCGWLGDLAARMVRANPGRYGLGCPTPEIYSPDTEPPEPPATPAPKQGDTPADKPTDGTTP